MDRKGPTVRTDDVDSLAFGLLQTLLEQPQFISYFTERVRLRLPFTDSDAREFGLKNIGHASNQQTKVVQTYEQHLFKRGIIELQENLFALETHLSALLNSFNPTLLYSDSYMNADGIDVGKSVQQDEALKLADSKIFYSVNRSILRVEQKIQSPKYASQEILSDIAAIVRAISRLSSQFALRYSRFQSAQKGSILSFASNFSSILQQFFEKILMQKKNAFPPLDFIRLIELRERFDFEVLLPLRQYHEAFVSRFEARLADILAKSNSRYAAPPAPKLRYYRSDARSKGYLLPLPLKAARESLLQQQKHRKDFQYLLKNSKSDHEASASEDKTTLLLEQVLRRLGNVEGLLVASSSRAGHKTTQLRATTASMAVPNGPEFRSADVGDALRSSAKIPPHVGPGPPDDLLKEVLSEFSHDLSNVCDEIVERVYHDELQLP